MLNGKIEAECNNNNYDYSQKCSNGETGRARVGQVIKEIVELRNF